MEKEKSLVLNLPEPQDYEAWYELITNIKKEDLKEII